MKKNLIPMNEFGLMADSEGVVRVDSRKVAEVFGKEHKNVLRDIKRISDPESGYTQDFIRLNFELISFKDLLGRKQPCYLLTRDGFSALVMGFTGPKANQFKEAYIRRFNEMENQIKTIQTLRDMNPMLTKAIQETRKDPKPFDYSNEADMLNRTVLDMTAKQFREKHGIPKSDPIRPHFTKEQADLMNYLMTIDIGLQYSMPDYQQRKRQLEWNAYKWQEEHGMVLLPYGQEDDALAS